MAQEVTLQDLLNHLRSDEDRPVLFRTSKRTLQPGYHLTEFRLARVRSVDCGRGSHEWSEATIEVLEGSGALESEHMRARKLTAIVTEVVDRLPEMGDAPLVVEFGSRGLSRYRVETVERTDGENWIVSLDPLRAQCKALLRSNRRVQPVATASTSCCASR